MRTVFQNFKFKFDQILLKKKIGRTENFFKKVFFKDFLSSISSQSVRLIFKLMRKYSDKKSNQPPHQPALSQTVSPETGQIFIISETVQLIIIGGQRLDGGGESDLIDEAASNRKKYENFIFLIMFFNFDLLNFLWSFHLASGHDPIKTFSV